MVLRYKSYDISVVSIIEVSNVLSPEAIGIRGEIILSNSLLRIRPSLKTSVPLGFKSCPLLHIRVSFRAENFNVSYDVDSCGQDRRKNSHPVPDQVSRRTAVTQSFYRLNRLTAVIEVILILSTFSYLPFAVVESRGAA